MNQNLPGPILDEGDNARIRNLFESVLVGKRTRRQSSAPVAVAPPPPLPFNRLASASTTSGTRKKNSKKNSNNKAAHLKSKGFRKDYRIGEQIRSPSHMMTMPTSEEAFQLVSTMKTHDFAFVKRSDGSYSYAILAFRSLEPSNNRRNANLLEEYMTFVVDFSRSTMVLKKEKWVECIHPCKTRGINRHHSQSVKRTKQTDEWVPPSIISFVPADSGEGDDFSLLSHTSRWNERNCFLKYWLCVDLITFHHPCQYRQTYPWVWYANIPAKNLELTKFLMLYVGIFVFSNI